MISDSSVYAIILIIALCGCSRTESTGIDPVDIDSVAEGIRPESLISPDVIKKWPADINEYEEYQTFDLFTLSASGSVRKKPFVYIKETPGYKIVRMSDDRLNPYIFLRFDDYWISLHGHDYNSTDALDIFSRPETRYSYLTRFIKNDSIFELEQEFFGTPCRISIHERLYTLDGVCLDLYEYLTDKEILLSDSLFDNLRKSIQSRRASYRNSNTRGDVQSMFRYRNHNGKWYRDDVMFPGYSEEQTDMPMMFFTDKVFYDRYSW